MSGASAASSLPPWQQYLCRVCGLVYDEAKGDPDSGLPPGTRFSDIPDDWACPICGVGKADFELYTPPDVSATPVRAARTSTGGVASRTAAGVVIVGAGRAGWQVAQALRKRDARLPITLVTACPADIYDKPMLSVAVARRLDMDALVREPAAAAADRLNLRVLSDTQAVAIDAPRRRLRTTRGTLRYQQLVLAHGAAPALPAALPAAYVWRVNDLVAYRGLRQALARGPQRVAIVGAGLVGCELANDFALAGHRVTLLDMQDRPLAAQLPPAASQRLLQAWQGLPIDFLGGVQVTSVSPTSGSGASAGELRLALRDGQVIDVDQVVAATGLRTPGRLAASAGLQYDAQVGGIVVDARCATSQAGVYALGDCVVMEGRASRYIEPIARQAQAIAEAVLGAAPSHATAAEAEQPPVLRVKTSALPITVTGTLDGAGRWSTLSDTPEELRLQRLSDDGVLLATLVARPPAPRMLPS